MISSVVLTAAACFSGVLALINRFASRASAGTAALGLQLILYTVVLGVRRIPRGSDTAAIVGSMLEGGGIAEISIGAHLLGVLGSAINMLGGGERAILVSLVMLSIGSTFLGYRAILRGRQRRVLGLAMFALLVTSSALLLWSNVLIQGLAAGLSVLAVGMYLTGREQWAYSILVIATLLHFSALIVLAALMAARYVDLDWRIYVIFAAAAVLFGVAPVRVTDMLPTFGFEWLAAKFRVYQSGNYSQLWVLVKIGSALGGLGALALALSLEGDGRERGPDYLFYRLIKVDLFIIIGASLFLSSPKVPARLLLYHGLLAPPIVAVAIDKVRGTGRLFGYAVGCALIVGFGTFVAFHPSVAQTLSY